MNKQGTWKVALTVVLATAFISSGAYAYDFYNKLNDPLATTSDFYKEWLEYKGSPLADKIYLDHPALSVGMEEKIESIISSFDKGGYDPVLLAQDRPSGVEMETTRQSDKAAVVTVWEDFGGNNKEIKVDLLKQGWRWQISDIRDPNQAQPLANSQYYQDMVADYVRENINELSPQKAVLGGKFSVTKINFGEGSNARVDYEDGHIALQADFQYELLPDNSLRIENFVVLDDNN